MKNNVIMHGQVPIPMLTIVIKSLIVHAVKWESLPDGVVEKAVTEIDVRATVPKSKDERIIRSCDSCLKSQTNSPVKDFKNLFEHSSA